MLSNLAVVALAAVGAVNAGPLQRRQETTTGAVESASSVASDASSAASSAASSVVSGASSTAASDASSAASTTAASELLFHRSPSNILSPSFFIYSVMEMLPDRPCSSVREVYPVAVQDFLHIRFSV